IEIGARAETRGQGRQARGVGLIGLPAAEAHEEGIGRVEDEIAANIKVIPILNQLARVRVVVKERKTDSGIRGRVAIGFGERFEKSLSDLIDASRRNYVRLRAAAHKLVSSAGIEDLDRVADAGGRVTCCRTTAEQLREIAHAHKIRRNGGKFRRTR